MVPDRRSPSSTNLVSLGKLSAPAHRGGSVMGGHDSADPVAVAAIQWDAGGPSVAAAARLELLLLRAALSDCACGAAWAASA
jgi:hypothetical protein